ncbi:histone-lysine N-methyltransferase SETDB1-B-like isoform X2 [Stegastes partitus]|uniref:Histone-lysine N-methyltransferase SETDB1-B-like isoform X2 n=1 Tax=Stegastes partitus TaxID=144197 RepID=A0A9Y4JM41_9TELE|nr:PREDICTED: histone-lysine N-methyltransferase SETDB1-B-like isoform X2 [Stegastes partitus]
MERDESETRTLELPKSRQRVKDKRKTESDDERDENENMSESPQDRAQWKNGLDSLHLQKKAVVVLTRLPEYKISALRPPTPPQFYSEDESLSSSDSDMQWETEDDSSDLECSGQNNAQKNGKSTKTQAFPANSNNDNVPETPFMVSSALAHCSHETTTTRPNLPEEEVKVDMIVLARKRPMRWQRGKVVEMLTKENGRLKYKVSFQEKGWGLVSGHHIAFNKTPKLEQLYVGARVVVRCQENKFWFRPGVLVELPSRQNRLRFLVFMDDHTPAYVGLPLLHLVCRPLEDVLDDIPDSPHKCFMKQYLKDWPYPPLNKYRAGQSCHAELNGVQQRCEVQLVDGSLMQVVFQDNQHKEWIYRGSIRLQSMARYLEWKERGEPKDDSD